MDTHLVLSLALTGLIGLSLGVFGGGGSIVAVPVLVFVTRVAPSAAVGMSLGIVGATSLVAAYAHHRRGQVRIKVALFFGGAGILTAFLGARLTHFVEDDALMFSFAAFMILVGSWMLTGNRRVRPSESQDESATETQRPRVARALLAGAVVGGITGFLGVGGGFLVVPALIAFARLGLREAVGTSLLVIAINSAAGFVGHVGAGRLDFGLVGALTIAAVLGAVAGERIARAISLAKLRRAFAIFVIAAGVAVATSSASRALAAAPSHPENPTAGDHGGARPGRLRRCSSADTQGRSRRPRLDDAPRGCVHPNRNHPSRGLREGEPRMGASPVEAALDFPGSSGLTESAV